MHKVWSAIEDYRPARSLLTAITVMAGLAAGPALAADPIKIGHVAALSGASAQSGEAITRGLRSRSTRSTPRAACSAAASSSWCSATTNQCRPRA